MHRFVLTYKGYHDMISPMETSSRTFETINDIQDEDVSVKTIYI